MSRKRSRNRSRGTSRSVFTRRRVIGLLTAGGLGVAGLQATGAFDSLTAQRQFDVATTEDGDAFLGVSGGQASGFDGDTITLLELTNRFDQPLTSISATVVSSGNPIDAQTLQPPNELAQGESAPVQATLDCSTDGTVELQITAASATQRVQLTRPVQVKCKSFDVCASRELPSGCVLNKIPKKSTDCSVVIDKSNQIDEQITGNTVIGGAAEFLSESQIKITLTGTPVIKEYLKLDTPSQIKFVLKGNSSIKNGVKIRTESQLTLDTFGEIGKGVCVANAGEVTFSPKNATIDDEISITSTDQVTIKKFINATTGPISIDAAGQVKFEKIHSSDISGLVDIVAAGQVTFSELSNASTGRIKIDADGQVKFENTRNSDIAGKINVVAPDQVKLDKLTNVSLRSVDIDADGQVDIVATGSTFTGDVTIPSAGGQVTLDFTNSEVTDGVSIINQSQIKLSLLEASTIGGSINIDTDSQIKVDLEGESLIDNNLTVSTESQVTLDLQNSNIDGSVTIDSQSQVDVTLDNSTITGDLTITTPGEVTISDCSAIEGSVKPQSAC